MSDVAIRVEGLGKRYRLGERAPYKTLRETITRAVAAVIGKALEPLDEGEGLIMIQVTLR